MSVLKTDMKSVPLLLRVLLLAVQVYSLTDPAVPIMFYPFGADEGDSIVPVGDGVSSTAVSIDTSFPFLFGSYSTVYVSIKCHPFTY